MAQGRPPRRSRKDREAVTLDLEAEKSPENGGREEKPSADGAPASDTPAKERSKEAAGKVAGAAATTDAAKAKEQPSAMVEATMARPVADEKPQRETPSDAAAAEPPEAADAAPKAGGDDAASPGPEPAPANRRRFPEVAIAFVAGIVGGIVVGAIGFGLYYGGVLPLPGHADLERTQTALSALGDDVGDLKQKVAMLNNAPPPEPDNAGEIHSLKAADGKFRSELSGLSKRVDRIEKQTSDAGPNAASKAAVGDLNTDMKALQDTVSGNGNRLEALSKHVDQLSSGIAQADSQEKLVKAIAAGALGTAIEQGGSFRAQLAVYRSVAPNDPAGAELEKLAAAGVPSRQRLLDEFPKAADAILAATSGAPPSSGIFDRLMASARSVIRIRPTGNVEGNGPKAIVARMGVGLRQGDLDAVAKEWSDLPEAGRSASNAFISDVKIRLKAVTLADRALKGATQNIARQQG